MFSSIFKTIFKDISHHLRFNTLNDTEGYGQNASGDIVKKIDIECEAIFIKHLENNKLNIIGYVSEETENVTFFKNVVVDDSKDNYIVAFDPLDGSGNYSSNINTGSIYGIYRYNKKDHKLIEIVDSGYCMYGINSIMVHTEENEAIMSILTGLENFIKVSEVHFNNISKRKKIYSINESGDYDPEIRFLLQQYKSNNYNMRWVGTLVADAHRILLNDGIFYYPSSNKHPQGKIRMLYESIPMAYIFKLAGGTGLSGNYRDILDRVSTFNLDTPHKSSSIILASDEEHKHLINLLELCELNKY